MKKWILAGLLLCMAGAAMAAECTPARYLLVFAINNESGGIAGYSQAYADGCGEGVTEAEIDRYRAQVAAHHRKKAPGLADDQVILLQFQPVRVMPAEPKKRGLIVL